MIDWVSVPDFPGYSVHPSGQVRRDGNGRLLHIKINQYGVAYVGLMRDGAQRQRSLARLVASMFIPEPREAFDTPINLDGNREDCSIDNLMWRPHWFAVLFNRQFRRPFESPIEHPILDINTNETYSCSAEACIVHGLLEKDVVTSIFNKTFVWPTYQVFELA